MANEEAFTLGGLALNDVTSWVVRSADVSPPPKRLLWLARKDGDTLGDVPGHDRREIVLKLTSKGGTASMDAALAEIGELTDKLQEAERTEGGIALTWTPAGSTKTLTAYVLAGEITGLPLSVDGDDAGWFVKRPTVEIRLDCDPFLYGTEVTETAVTNTNPHQELTIANVTGDVPAEGRVILTDNGTQERDFADWGMQSTTPAQAALALLIDSASWTTSGYSGTATTRTGAYSASGVIRGTTSPNWVALASTGDLSHVGVFRVKARVYCTTADAQVQFAWRAGDAPHTRNAAKTPQMANQWVELDLGEIRIPEATLGTQRWEGRLEYKADTAGANVDLDYIDLIPAERYGKARAPLRIETPTVFSARDEFDQSAGALTGKAAAAGGNWAGAGDADDFQVDATNHRITRAVGNDSAGIRNGRHVTISGLVLARAAVRARFDYSAANQTGVRFGVELRWVDSSNWLAAVYSTPDATTAAKFEIWKCVTGTETLLKAYDPVGSYPGGRWTEFVIRAFAFESGAMIANISLDGNDDGISIVTQDAALATGGALDDGSAGLVVHHPTVAVGDTIAVDDFAAWVPASDAAIYSGQSLEFNSSDTQREDSGGTLYGRPRVVRGSRVFIPQSGSEGRTARIVGRARRNDVEEFPDDQIADSTSLQVKWTPRYLNAPR